jgi:hypothetical protein
VLGPPPFNRATVPPACAAELKALGCAPETLGSKVGCLACSLQLSVNTSCIVPGSASPAESAAFAYTSSSTSPAVDHVQVYCGTQGVLAPLYAKPLGNEYRLWLNLSEAKPTVVVPDCLILLFGIYWMHLEKARLDATRGGGGGGGGRGGRGGAGQRRSAASEQEGKQRQQQPRRRQLQQQTRGDQHRRKKATVEGTVSFSQEGKDDDGRSGGIMEGTPLLGFPPPIDTSPYHDADGLHDHSASASAHNNANGASDDDDAADDHDDHNDPAADDDGDGEGEAFDFINTEPSTLSWRLFLKRLWFLWSTRVVLCSIVLFACASTSQDVFSAFYLFAALLWLYDPHVLLDGLTRGFRFLVVLNWLVFFLFFFYQVGGIE